MTTDALTTAVTDAVSARTDTPVAELPPLYESVDMDAVGSVVEHTDGRPRADTTVRFAYHGCFVTVDGDGTVDIHDDDGSPVRDTSPRSTVRS